MTAKLSANLDLDRCPHCSIDRPNLRTIHQFETLDHTGQNRRRWRIYGCSRCGGVVAASAPDFERIAEEVYPRPPEIHPTIPSPASNYLKQAIDSLHAPAGAVMLAASAVDAMLKAKGYKEGTLYERIDKAAKDHLITPEMATWAHEVRLDANDPRHADEKAPLPNEAGAKKAVDFTQALAQLLFVLPARVQRGLAQAQGKATPQGGS